MNNLQKRSVQTRIITIASLIVVLSCQIGKNPQPAAATTTADHPTADITATFEPTHTAEKTATITATATLQDSPTPTQTNTSTLSPTPAASPTPQKTATLDLSPNIKFPRAKVLEQANCRYGPGVAYLYKYGLFPGNRIEVIGRNDLGTWAYIRGIGGTNACWVSVSVLEMKDDIFSVQSTYSKLPMSDLYQPPASASAVRKGNTVVVSWSAVWMTEDDYRGYLIEAWVCQNGQLIFTPVRSDALIYNFTDEPGCSEPSKGRLYTAEKHGYTQWITLAWPAHRTPTPNP